MKINAKLHRITNLNQFIADFLQTSGKPTKGFTDFGQALVHLATDFPAGLFPDEPSFIPAMSLKTNTDAKGKFSLNVPEGLKNSRGYLIAYQQVGTVQPMPNIPAVPIFAPFYRSQDFKLSAATEGTKDIFVHQMKTDDDKGLSQDQLNAIAKEIKSKGKFERVSATIKESLIACRVEKEGAVGTFNIHPRPSTGHDLNRVVGLKADNIDIDLPGPDFIVGICVDEDDIKRQLRSQVASFSSVFNQTINESIPEPARKMTSLTVHRFRFPVTGHKTVKAPVPGVPDIQVPLRSVVPDVSVGVPRTLF